MVPPVERATLEAGSFPLQLKSQPEGIAQARELLSRLEITGDYVVLHPGSGADVKLWPSSRWRSVVRAINDRGVPVIVSGSRSEADLTQEIARHQTCAHDVSGKTSIPALTELMRGARLVLGTDNGPLHLAVACGVPSIHLFGPSSADRYGAWGPPYRHQVVTSGWSCPRCGDLSVSRAAGCGCMLAIATDSVIAAANAVLDRHASS